MVVQVYNKTHVSGLQTFLGDKFAVWASNVSNVEEIWNNLKKYNIREFRTFCATQNT